MRSPSEIIKDILVADGLGNFGGLSDWDIYIGFEPKKPFNVVTINDLEGNLDNFYQRNEFAVENSFVQIRVSGVDKKITYDKIRQLSKNLELKNSLSFVDVNILSIVRTTDFFDLGINRESKKTFFVYTVSLEMKLQRK